MSPDDARAILINAFIASPNLTDDQKKLLAKLILPPKRKRWFRRR